jgi:RNA polymerase sigma-70 factor (ECF subfamily)
MDEQKLIALAKAGDQQSFGELVDRYQRFVWNVALRMTGDCDEAEDIAQEVFVTVWKKLPQFKGASAFSTWLYKITANRTLTFIKNRATQGKRRDEMSMELISHADEQSTNPSLSIENREAERMLTHLLERLDPERRMALILREIEGLSYSEIATATGAPIGTVRSRIARGRRELESSARGMREMA